MPTRELEIGQAHIYKTTSSFSHILGNMTAIIEDYIIKMMPPNYFKQIRATTEVAFKDIKDLKKNLIAPEKPFMIVDPKLLLNEESESLPQINWDRFNPTDHNDTPSLYMMNHEFFIKNEDISDKKFALGYTLNRYKFQFDITILVNTQMQRLSLVNYLKSNFRFRHYFEIKRYTETLIPNSYIQYIADTWRMDITSNDFLQKLNTESPYTILRLHRPATDKTEFFIMIMNHIELKLPSYPTEDSVRTGRVEKYSQVAFSIEVETNVMNNFLLLSYDTVTTGELTSEYMTRVNIDARNPTIDKIRDNKTLYTKVMIEFDELTEEIDFNKFMGDDIKPVLKYIKNNNLTDNFISVYVYQLDVELDNTDTNIMTFNPKTLKLNFHVPNLEDFYNFAIYFDMNYIARVKKYIQPVNTTKDDYEK